MAVRGSYQIPQSVHLSKTEFQQNVGVVQVAHTLCSPLLSPSEDFLWRTFPTHFSPVAVI